MYIYVVVLFLVIPAIINITQKRKVDDICNYNLRDQNLSTLILVTSTLMTWIGMFFVITVQKIYAEGLYYVFASLGQELSLIATAYFLLPRTLKWINKPSISTVMGEIYGKQVKLITSVASSIAICGIIAVQFKMTANALSHITGTSILTTSVLTGLVITLYSIKSGSVKLHSIDSRILIILITFALLFSLYKSWMIFYTNEHITNCILNNPFYNIANILNINNQNLPGMLLLFCYCTIPTLIDPAFHRINRDKNTKQLKSVFTISAACLILIKLLIIALVLWFSLSNCSIDVDNMLVYFITTNIPSFLVILFYIIAFQAFNRINVATLLIIKDNEDILQRLNLDASKTSRFIAAIIGIIAIAFALSEKDLLEMLISAHSFYYPVVMPLFLLTIFDFKIDKNIALTSMISGLICSILWRLFGTTFCYISINLGAVMFGMLANLIILFTARWVFRITEASKTL